jgi:hypothetical protein
LAVPVHGWSRRTGGRLVGAISTQPGRQALSADLAIRGIDFYSLQGWQIAGCAQVLTADPTSEFAKAFGSDGYSLDQHLLFMVLDELRIANWLHSRDGEHNRNRPERVSPLAQRIESIGHIPEGRTVEDVKALLARFGPQPMEVNDASTDD